jgi:hypothetical protein
MARKILEIMREYWQKMIDVQVNRYKKGEINEKELEQLINPMLDQLLDIEQKLKESESDNT